MPAPEEPSEFNEKASFGIFDEEPPDLGEESLQEEKTSESAEDVTQSDKTEAELPSTELAFDVDEWMDIMEGKSPAACCP